MKLDPELVTWIKDAAGTLVIVVSAGTLGGVIKVFAVRNFYSPWFFKEERKPLRFEPGCLEPIALGAFAAAIFWMANELLHTEPGVLLLAVLAGIGGFAIIEEVYHSHATKSTLDKAASFLAENERELTARKAVTPLPENADEYHAQVEATSARRNP